MDSQYTSFSIWRCRKICSPGTGPLLRIWHRPCNRWCYRLRSWRSECGHRAKRRGTIRWRVPCHRRSCGRRRCRSAHLKTKACDMQIAFTMRNKWKYYIVDLKLLSTFMLLFVQKLWFNCEEVAKELLFIVKLGGCYLRNESWSGKLAYSAPVSNSIFWYSNLRFPFRWTWHVCCNELRHHLVI